jgi:hypothetical protein
MVEPISQDHPCGPFGSCWADCDWNDRAATLSRSRPAEDRKKLKMINNIKAMQPTTSIRNFPEIAPSDRIILTQILGKASRFFLVERVSAINLSQKGQSNIAWIESFSHKAPERSCDGTNGDIMEA